MKNKINLLIIMFLCSSSYLLAKTRPAPNRLAKIYLSYAKGNYKKALNQLDSFKGEKKEKALVNYWKGKILFKLQRYELASQYFKKAKQNGSAAKDLNYQYAQTLYANQSLEKARRYFLRSYQSRYKQGTSLYYAGFIGQILEQPKKAKKYYKRILVARNDKDDVKKAAMFQMAELNYSELMKNEKKRDNRKHQVIHFILPEMKKAKDYQPKKPLTQLIKRRMAAIQREHKIRNVSRMLNGKAIAKKPLSLRFGLNGKYDSNLTLTAEDASAQPINKSAFYEAVNIFTSYEMVFKRRFIITPQLTTSLKYHNERADTNIYKNDNFMVTPLVKMAYEGRLLKKKASTFLHVEYSYTGQDRLAQKKLGFYNSYIAGTLGQEVQPFKIGPTTLKIKYKKQASYSAAQDLKSITGTLRQAFPFSFISLVNRLTYSLSADFSRFRQNISDTNTYTNTFSFNIPKRFFKYYKLAPSFALTLTDTKANDPARGLEVTYNPSLKVSRKFRSLNVSFAYSFTKKTSKDTKIYAYTKHALDFGVIYNF